MSLHRVMMPECCLAFCLHLYVGHDLWPSGLVAAWEGDVAVMQCQLVLACSLLFTLICGSLPMTLRSGGCLGRCGSDVMSIASFWLCVALTLQEYGGVSTHQPWHWSLMASADNTDYGRGWHVALNIISSQLFSMAKSFTHQIEIP